MAKLTYKASGTPFPMFQLAVPLFLRALPSGSWPNSFIPRVPCKKKKLQLPYGQETLLGVSHQPLTCCPMHLLLWPTLPQYVAMLTITWKAILPIKAHANNGWRVGFERRENVEKGKEKKGWSLSGKKREEKSWHLGWQKVSCWKVRKRERVRKRK